MRLQGTVRVAGTMSGTSLDGVDAAVLETDGRRIAAFGPSRYRPYAEDERRTLRAALGHWPGSPEAEAAARLVEEAHAEVLDELLGDAAAGKVELVGFHGQTLAHAPETLGTHQAGDGARLAERLGLAVVWDFRTSDVQFGGQGAPLAPAFHHALALKMEAEAPVAFLNLGGVGNVTWIDPGHASPELPGALLAFDTGPANAPINDLVQERCNQPFDQDGALAAAGEVDEEVVRSFMEGAFFRRVPPKSLDRDAFRALTEATATLSNSDAAATLTAAAARAVAAATEHFPAPAEALYVTGGGRKNGVLMDMISEALPMPVVPVEEVGFDGDMLEAQAFGHLAARVAAGLPTTFPGTTGVPAAIGGGEVSVPIPEAT